MSSATKPLGPTDKYRVQWLQALFLAHAELNEAVTNSQLRSRSRILGDRFFNTKETRFRNLIKVALRNVEKQGVTFVKVSGGRYELASEPERYEQEVFAPVKKGFFAWVSNNFRSLLRAA